MQLMLEETLGELELMERIGLFTNTEIRKITRKRKQHYYYLQRRVKTKEEYLKYIEYEIHLLKLVTKRRELHGIRGRKSDIDNSVASRINHVYKSCVFRYQSDVELWESYIKFLEWMGWNDMVSKIYTRMLQVHSNKPAIWIAAAKWEMEVLKAAESARALMLRALRCHPKCKEIFLQYFEIELMYSDQISKRRNVLGLKDMENSDEASDAIVQKKLAYAVFRNAMEIMNDVDFHLQFLPITQKYEDTDELHKEMFIDIQDRYSTAESMWNYLAKTHLIDNNKRLTKICQESNVQKEEVLKKSYVDCFETFKTAVEVIPTESMWTFYINCCLEGMRSADVPPLRSTETLELSRKEVLEAMQLASSRQLLAKNLCLEWVTLLKENESSEGISEILLMSTEKYNSSSVLWKTRIENLIVNDASISTVQQAFNDAINAVDVGDSLVIWMLAFKWTRMVSPERLPTFFQTAVTQESGISTPFKSLYLEYVALNEDVTEARKLYERLRFQHPISKDFFYKMLNIEAAQLSSKIDRQRRIMEDLLEHYGKNDIKPWLDYINLEKTHPQGRRMNISKIHWRAMKNLNPLLEARFSTAYSLILTRGM